MNLNPVAPEPALCGSCKANILWAVTPQDKRIPLDAKPEKRFVITRPEDNPGRLGGALMVDAYLTHFATCPNAAAHRKPRSVGA